MALMGPSVPLLVVAKRMRFYRVLLVPFGARKNEVNRVRLHDEALAATS
jgi:hypothetical protein